MDLQKFKIEKGNKNFEKDFYNLVLLTGKEVIPTIFSEYTEDLLKYFYKEKDNQFSYEFVNFATINDKICGMVLSYSFKEKKKIELNTGILIFKKLRFAFLKILPNLINSFFVLGNILNGDYYISNIAVYQEYRNLGIGKALLNFCEKNAKNKKQNRIVLEVEKENENAIIVYEKLGFRKEKELNLKIKDKKFSFYKMVKNLNNSF
ncbi:MAG: GNAT family N-acetyltransferase [Caldisericia bacterium]